MHEARNSVVLLSWQYFYKVFQPYHEQYIQQLSGDDSNSEYDQPESIIERIEDLQEKRTSLTKVWMQLTDAEQELLYRKYVLDQTTEELAGIFQCSRDSIRMRLSRARRKSLRLMKGEGTNDETRTTSGKL